MGSTTGLVDERFNEVIVHKLDSNKKQVIASLELRCSDSLTITQDDNNTSTDRTVSLPQSADITVYADTLTINGPIKANGKSITIYARSLCATKDSHGNEAALIVDGEAGKDADDLALPAAATGPNGTPGHTKCIGHDTAPGTGLPGTPAIAGNDGKRGADAGSIHIYCTTVDAGISLALSATGGRGGNGSKGQDGARGGTGGAGEDAFLCGLGMWALAGQDGGPGGPGLAGGSGGNAGFGGSAGPIVFSCAGAVPSGVKADASVGASGIPGSGGDAGEGGDGGPGGDGTDQTSTTGGPVPKTHTTHIPGGSTGPSGSQSIPGAEGTVSVGKAPVSATPTLAKQTFDQLFPATHQLTPWLAMMQTRADYDFLAAGDDASSPHMTSAEVRYGWLWELANAHQAAKTKADPLVTRIFDNALTAVHFMQMGLNYFGRPSNFAPVGSLKYWQDQTQDALKDLKWFEPIYQQFSDLSNASQDRIAEVKTTLSASKGRVSALKVRSNELIKALPAKADLISNTDLRASDAGAKVLADLSKLASAIQSACGLKPADFISALGSIAFMQGQTFNKVALATGQVGKLTDSAINKVVADDGTKVEKSYLVNKVLVAGKDFADLKEGFQMASHLISVNDPNATKLIHEKRTIDALLNKIASWKTAKATRQALDEYLQLVNARNHAILDYNALVRRILKIENDIHSEMQREKELQSNIADVDPELQQTVNYMADVYKVIKSNYVNSLYSSMRAAAFWSVDETLSLDAVVGTGADPRQLDMVTATQWQTNANKILQARHAALGGSVQDFSGISLILDGGNLGDAFNGLITGNHTSIQFSMQPVSKSTKASESPFAGLADVRVKNVRVWLHGATTGDGECQVTAHHLGQEILVSHNDQPMDVSHEPRSVVFRYEVAFPKNVKKISVDGDILKADESYAPVGPFADWIIDLNPSYNVSLDLSKLKSIELEFSGTARSFD